jgi:hypothetical protein
MPKNPVTDPITNQEIAFAHLVLSGTMTDCQAAEAVGLNPTTAAYTKSKPRVRAYMHEHQAAVRQKLVEQEAEGLRNLNLSRDQILARLWELANLSPEATRGSITGQVKAMSMIVAIVGLIPGRRLATAHEQPAPPLVKPDVHVAEPIKSVTATEVAPAAHLVPEPPPPKPHTTPPLNPFTYSKGQNSAISDAYNVNLNATLPLTLRIPSGKGVLARGR